jgi:hypothetical protein
VLEAVEKREFPVSPQRNFPHWVGITFSSLWISVIIMKHFMLFLHYCKKYKDINFIVEEKIRNWEFQNCY